MSETIIPRARTASAAGWGARLAADLLARRLEGLEDGEITLIDGEHDRTFGRPGGLRATVEVLHPAFYSAVVFGGSLGAAESYIAGEWRVDDLTRLCRIFARDGQANDELESGWARVTAPLAQLVHWLHSNTRRGSGRNIRAHYDLGNDFFRLFLDPTMSYSCGWFETSEATMQEASIAKIDRACRKLSLQESDHLLEIGTGWGALAIHAAREYGCRVTTTTISNEQHALAKQRIEKAGLSSRITLLRQDYRDLQGTFDKVVSIEMIEAVGHRFLPVYFGHIGRLLEPDGAALIQAITMPDHRYERYRRSVDFIQKFVFPGSCLPSVTAMCRAASESSDLRLAHLEDLTPHYAETLRRWRTAFFENLEQVREQGYPDEFIRLWEYYLCYCEAGFDEGLVGDVQALWTKPRRTRDTVAL